MKIEKIKLSNENKQTDSNVQIDTIKQLLYEKKMSILVGSGFSKNVNKKFPTWIELLKDMVLEMYEKEYKEYIHFNQINDNQYKVITFVRKIVNKIGYLEIVEKYIEFKGMREAITFYIEDQLQEVSNGKKDLEVHEKLISLPWNNIYTTNYDTLLEDTSSKINSDYVVVKESKKLALGLKKRIIKLHGSLRDQSEIDKNTFGFDGDKNKHYIIAKSDYDTYPEKHEAFTQLMRIALLQESFCLIGFSGDDPNFIKWIEWVREVLKKEKVYLIDASSEDVSKERKLFFKNYGIVHVPLKDIYEANTPKEKVKNFLLELEKPQKSEREKQTQNLYGYEKLWEEIKLNNDLKNILELEKYFTFPNKRVMSSAKHQLLNSRIELLKKIKSNKKEEILYGANFLGLCLRNSYTPLSMIYKDVQIKEIEKSLEGISDSLKNNTEKKNWLSLAEFILKNKRFNMNEEGFNSWKEKIKLLEYDVSNISNIIIYEEALLYSLNFEKLEKILKNWNIKKDYSGRWFLVKKAFLKLILNSNDTSKPLKYIQDAKKLMENTQDKLFIFELESYYNQAIKYSFSSEITEKMKEYEALGCYRISDLIDSYFIKENKIQNLKRFQSKPTIIGNTKEEKEYFDSFHLTEIIFDIGYPLRINRMALINEKDWIKSYKYIMKKNFNLGIILSLFYGGNDSDEKFILELFKLIKNSNIITEENKIYILKRLIKLWYYNSERKIIDRKILFAISELIKVIEYSIWESFFIDLWNEVKVNKQLKELIYTKMWGLANPFSEFLPFINNTKIIEEILIENLKIKGLDRDSFSKNVSLNNIFNLLHKYNLNILEKLNPTVIIETIKNDLILELDEVKIIKLFYLKDIITKELIIELKEIFLKLNISKKNNTDIILKIFSYDNDIVNKVKKNIFDEPKILFKTNIKEKSRSFTGDSFSIDFLIDGTINLEEFEILIIFERLKESFDELLKWNEHHKDTFFKNTDLIILNDMKNFLIVKKSILEKNKSQDVIIKLLNAINKLYTELTGCSNYINGLTSTDPDKLLNSTKELYEEIIFNLETPFDIEYELFLLNILSKKEIRLEENINFFSNIFYSFKDIKTPWILNYTRYYLEILRVYEDWNNVEMDMEFIEEKLIKVAYLLKENYNVNDEILDVWIRKKNTTIFQKIRLMKISI